MQEQVTMTPEERAEYEEFKAKKAQEREEAARKQQREDYAILVNCEVSTAVTQLTELSETMRIDLMASACLSLQR